MARQENPGRLRLVRERARDAAAIEEMNEAAFGPDRHHKTVYRLREGIKPIKRPVGAALSTEALVKGLDDGNLAWRLTMQRLLIEGQIKAMAGSLEKLALEAVRPQGRAHALWTLDGLNVLREPLPSELSQSRAPDLCEEVWGF